MQLASAEKYYAFCLKSHFEPLTETLAPKDFGFAMHLASDGLLIRLSFQRVASGDVGCMGVWFMETVLFTSPYEHLMCMVGELLVETEFYSCERMLDML